MKSIFLILLSCFISGCSDADNTFYYDIECDGKPMQIHRYVVDKERQTVLLQHAWFLNGEVEEESAYYLENCKVTDSKNFICGTYPGRQYIFSNGSLLVKQNLLPIKRDSCTYKKRFWGFRKIADATVKDTKSPPLQNK